MSFLSPSDDSRAISSITGWGGQSSSSTSDTHSWTWNSSQIENMMNNFDPTIYWENKNIDPMNGTLRQMLDYMESGTAINNANNVLNWGNKAFGMGIDRLRKTAAITPEQYWNAISGGANKIYGEMSGWLEQQDTSIENNVAAQMGSEFAQNAEMQNAGGAVAGSSAMNNSAMYILAGGENSAASQEMQLNARVMSEALGTSTNMVRGYGRMENSLTNAALGIGSGALEVGAKMKGTATKNMWNAGLVDQLAAQLNTNNNRRNRMISGNLPLVEQELWLATELQAAGVDTNTHTESSNSGGQSGWF